MKTVPNILLFKAAEAALDMGETIRIRLVGNSMYPFLHENEDIVVIAPHSLKELRRGEIVLFRYGDSYCLHRIISIRNGNLRLCGDANHDLCETIRTEDVIGILRNICHSSGNSTECRSLLWRIKGEIWMRLRPVRKYLIASCIRLHYHR